MKQQSKYRRSRCYKAICRLLAKRSYSTAELAKEVGCSTTFVRRVISELMHAERIDCSTLFSDLRQKRYQLRK